MNSQETASQRRLEHEAASAVRPVNGGLDMFDQQILQQTLRELRLPIRYAGEVETLLSRGTLSREIALHAVVGREFISNRVRKAEKGRQRQTRRASR